MHACVCVCECMHLLVTHTILLVEMKRPSERRKEKIELYSDVRILQTSASTTEHTVLMKDGSDI